MPTKLPEITQITIVLDKEHGNNFKIINESNFYKENSFIYHNILLIFH